MAPGPALQVVLSRLSHDLRPARQARVPYEDVAVSALLHVRVKLPAFAMLQVGAIERHDESGTVIFSRLAFKASRPLLE